MLKKDKQEKQFFSKLERSFIYEVACGKDKSFVKELYLDNCENKLQMEREDFLYFSFLSELFNEVPDLYYRNYLRQKIIEKHQKD